MLGSHSSHRTSIPPLLLFAFFNFVYDRSPLTAEQSLVHRVKASGDETLSGMATVEVKQYHIPPTALMPNSPYPLLYYPALLKERMEGSDNIAPEIHDMFASNGWMTQWIFRYGQTQEAHYHRQTHECMVVLTGTATIRFGAADTSADLEESSHGGAKEVGGIEIEARAGDVFVLPAGLAHKTYNTTPAKFALLTPGKGRGIEAQDIKTALAKVDVTSGFQMMGAYPTGGEWDYATGGEDAGQYDQVWSVPKPERDLVLGSSSSGLCGRWQHRDMSSFNTGTSRGPLYSGMTIDVDFLK